MLFTPSVTYLLAVCAFSSASPFLPKRSGYSGALYAYGTEIGGSAVYFIDGLAYMGSASPDWASVAANITFTASDTTTTPWTIAANLTDSNLTSAPFPDNSYSMYIIPTNGNFQQVGFVSSNGTAPTNAVTEGFTWFGTSVAYAENDSNYELQFWANATNTTDVYALYWNANGTTLDTAFPIAIKSTAPAVLTAAAME